MDTSYNSKICLQTYQHTTATHWHKPPPTAQFEIVSKFQTDPIDTIRHPFSPEKLPHLPPPVLLRRGSGVRVPSGVPESTQWMVVHWVCFCEKWTRRIKCGADERRRRRLDGAEPQFLESLLACQNQPESEDSRLVSLLHTGCMFCIFCLQNTLFRSVPSGATCVVPMHRPLPAADRSMAEETRASCKLTVNVALFSFP